MNEGADPGGDGDYLVLLGERPQSAAPPALPAGYRAEYWTPAPLRLMPPGPRSYKQWLIGLAHLARVLGGRDYGAVILRHGTEVVHRSSVFPAYFAFPFMGAADVQVGGTWTSARHRGRGLARAAIALALERQPPGRRVWYVVERGNAPSLRVGLGAGLRVVARATRRARRWAPILGRYEVVSWLAAAPARVLTPPGTPRAPASASRAHGP